jgi:hypothetical protein
LSVGANLCTANRCAIARRAVGIFFPQRPLLKIDEHGYSRAILSKIVAAGSQLKSFALAETLLLQLAEVSISARHVGRLTEMIGQELREKRDRYTEDWLHHRRVEPTVPAPAAVAVAVDGGRLMTREPGHGPGVHEQGWKEDKVACLHTLAGPTFETDPQPQPPECFLDAAYVDDLVKALKSHKGLEETERSPLADEPARPATALASGEEAAMPEGAPLPKGGPEPVAWPPERLQRTCVATQQDSDAFGPMVAAEAYARNFHAAPRRAFLGDGQACNWTIQRKWFKDYEAIADFVHPLSYLYVAATLVATTMAERWRFYVTWITACWQGRVADVLADLTVWQERLGPVRPDEAPPDNDPRVQLAKTVTYLRNNQERMDYPRYRCRGLPVTSCAVESLIKEFNYRVKGTEKFWNAPDGTETILQMRAAVLSDDNRLSDHLAARPGSAYRGAAGKRQRGRRRPAA